MAGKNNQWVSPRPNGWAVHRENSQRDTKLFETQKEAEDFARQVARNQRVEVITQRPDGRIRSKDSYGNDPCPPRDMEH